MITKISVSNKYLLKIEMNNEIKYFDVEPYLELGDFKILKDKEIFDNFEVDELNGVVWLDGTLSLSIDTLLEHSYKTC